MKFYNRFGEPSLYSEDDKHLYSFVGKPIGYIVEDKIYSYLGKHLGWLHKEWIIDLNGEYVYFSEKTYDGPMKPMKKMSPMKGMKQLKPMKHMKEAPKMKPIKQTSWSQSEIFE